MRRLVFQPVPAIWAPSLLLKLHCSVKVGAPVPASKVTLLASTSPVHVVESYLAPKLELPLSEVCGSAVANDVVYARRSLKILAKARFRPSTIWSGLLATK